MPFSGIFLWLLFFRPETITMKGAQRLFFEGLEKGGLFSNDFDFIINVNGPRLRLKIRL